MIFAFDGFGGKELSGLQAVDWHNEPDPRKGQGVAGTRLENGRKYTAEFIVTVENYDATIDVKLDGKPFLTWTGPILSLSLIDARFSLNDTRRIGLGAWESTVRFDSLQLKILQGKAKLLRTPNVEPPSQNSSPAP